MSYSTYIRLYKVFIFKGVFFCDSIFPPRNYRHVKVEKEGPRYWTVNDSFKLPIPKLSVKTNRSQCMEHEQSLPFLYNLTLFELKQH